MDYLYVITSACILTWFRWNQHIQGRSYPFVGISCLYGMWMLANGITIPLDGVTVATLAFAVWLLGSILWAQKALCVYELFNWFSYLILFTAARGLDLEFVMCLLVVNPSLFAAQQLLRSAKYSIHEEARLYPVFGNSNHNAAFMLVGMFCALWLSFHSIPWMLVFAALMGVAILQSMRRGPAIAIVFSLMLYAVLVRSEASVYMLIVAFVAAIPNRARLMLMAEGYFMSDRMDIYKDAWNKTSPRFLMGRGLNYFRDTKYGRVHNDPLELTGEIGLIGLALFINIFLQMSLEPILICAVVAFFIDAMFFYPFREQHTATPFWVMAGAAAGFHSPASMILLQVVGVLVAGVVLLFVFTVFSNLVKWEGEMRNENKGMDRAKLRQSARA